MDNVTLNELSLRFSYIRRMKDCNKFLSDVNEFYLYPGMEFRSKEKWWPDSGTRPTLHEGIDLCYYKALTGEEKCVTPEFNVPVMAKGRIFAICQDYLGWSVFLDHLYETKYRFLSVYAHIVPIEKLIIGSMVDAGDVIGNIADTLGRKNRMPAHLHISLMSAKREIPEQLFDWDLICSSTEAELLDPLEMIDTVEIKCRARNHWKEMYGF